MILISLLKMLNSSCHILSLILLVLDDRSFHTYQANKKKYQFSSLPKRNAFGSLDQSWEKRDYVTHCDSGTLFWDTPHGLMF